MQTDSQALYTQYENITLKAADIQNAAAVLGWDQEVYMPRKGFAFRGRQLATLAGQAHELVTSNLYGDLLQELAGRADLTDVQLRNVQLSLEDYTKNAKLPAAFVEEVTRQSSASFNAWISAREANDYGVYREDLQRMIDLKKQQANYYGFTGHIYDALLDDYEKGATVAMLEPVFQEVRLALPPLLEKIAAAGQVNDRFFYQHFSKKGQWDFSMEVLKAMGYDFDAGRQDLSEHPFTTSFAPTDVRVTTRVNEQDFSSLLWSSIHEGGHALYEQGLPEAQYGKPLGAAASLAVHESQSRLWENCVGRGLPFWEHFYPALQQYFPGQLGKTPVMDFYKGMNLVKPSCIRTEADEVTYHFHVMIRYEIEKGLMDGSLDAKDLRDIWNSYYQRYLGITPANDKEGVLQDVHWCHGSFGYFPTYSLGSFYAAQYFEEAKRQLPGLEQSIASGRFADLLHWLRVHVHQYGRRFAAEELCTRITGKPLDFKVFMSYVENKYKGIYDLK